MSPPRLLAITPPTGAVDPGKLELWLAAGAGEQVALWLREPGGRPSQLLGARLRPLVERARAHGIAVLLGIDSKALEEAAVVLEAEALQGLVLRGDPAREQLLRARERIGVGPLLGRSCHDAGADDHDACDVTVLGPVFAPRTAKTFPIHPIGPEALTRASASPDAFVIALGGLDARRAKACLAAGARGLAGIRSFFGDPQRVAEDVAAFCRALRRAKHGSKTGATGGRGSTA
jgi:thiamine monophosphate synthase